MLNRSLAAWAVLALLGCTSQGSGNEEVRLSWRFVDGRACDLAGVVDILVAYSSNHFELSCADGLSPDHHQEITFSSFPSTLTLDGRTATGAVLYEGRAEVTADDFNEDVVVTLRFVGGRSQ